MTIGIYCLRFEGTDKVYIGKSTRIEDRYTEHKYNFKNNIASKKMQSGYIEFGVPTLEVLCECTEDDLSNNENYYIEKHNSVDNGFNTLKLSDDIPTGVGEDCPSSKHTNKQIIDAFMLMITTNKTFKDISIDTNVSINTIKSISTSTTHLWLDKEFPEQYKILRTLKGARLGVGESASYSKYSNEQIIAVFKLLIDKEERTANYISNITGVSTGVIYGVSNSSLHLWLEEMFSEEYKILKSLNGSRKNNVGMSAKARGIIYPEIVSPMGVKYLVENVTKFARENGLIQSCLSQLLNRKAKSHKGWKLA